MNGPKLSLIMPTGDRSLFVRRAIEYLHDQTYRGSPVELVIVDGGRRPLALHRLHVSPRAAVNILRVDSTTKIGERRNLAVDAARGDLIVHWDDDDFYAPDYLASVVTWWEGQGSTCVELGGMCQFYHYHAYKKRGWRSHLWEQIDRPYGASFVYPKYAWKALGGFAPLQLGEDNDFYQRIEAKGGLVKALARPDLFVYIRHDRNVSLAGIDPILHPGWTDDARKILGPAVDFYDDLAELVPMPTAQDLGPSWHNPANTRPRTR